MIEEKGYLVIQLNQTFIRKMMMTIISEMLMLQILLRNKWNQMR